MKKLLAILVVVAMLASMLVSFSLTAYADDSVLTQTEKNTRDTVPPKHSDGRYKITAWWDKNITHFEDETPTDDTTSDSFIDRLSRSEAVSTSGSESWFTHPNYGGTWWFDASGSAYKNGDAWFQMDMGISSKVTSIQYKVDHSGAYNFDKVLYNTPPYGQSYVV